MKNNHYCSNLNSGLFVTAAAVLGLLFQAGAAQADSAETRSAPEVLFANPAPDVNKKLQAAFADLASRDLLSGTVLIGKGDKVLFQGVYGLASREYNVPNKLDTQFNMASSNKMFTAVAIARLYEQGKLRFDDPIGKYLGPDWISEEIGKKVTIEHLLTHTADLSDYLGPLVKQHKPLYKKFDDLKPLLAKTTLQGEPGKKWDYNNTGFALLGAVVENVCGKDYFECVKELVFDPAGMTRTAALDLERVNSNYAQGYRRDPQPHPQPRGPMPANMNNRMLLAMILDFQMSLKPGSFEWKNNTYLLPIGSPAGGMYSTAQDLHNFVATLTSGRLLKPETVKLMMTPKPPAAPRWGYGMEMFEDGGIGHSGGFMGISTLIVMYPNDYHLIIMSNNDGGAFAAQARLLEVAGMNVPLPSATQPPK